MQNEGLAGPSKNCLPQIFQVIRPMNLWNHLDVGKDLQKRFRLTKLSSTKLAIFFEQGTPYNM